MPSATTANVTVDRSWTETGITGKQRIGILCRVGGGTFGGTTNTIPASAFGLSNIEMCSGVVAVDDIASGSGVVCYLAVPGADGSVIYLINIEQATDANRSLPADVDLSSNTIRIEVHGYA